MAVQVRMALKAPALAPIKEARRPRLQRAQRVSMNNLLKAAENMGYREYSEENKAAAKALNTILKNEGSKSPKLRPLRRRCPPTAPPPRAILLLGREYCWADRAAYLARSTTARSSCAVKGSVRTHLMAPSTMPGLPDPTRTCSGVCE